LCPGDNLGTMTEKDAVTATNASPAGEKPATPETEAEKAERRRFEEAREEHRIIDGVRTKIDKDK
jgi:hypothetical protein